MDSQKSVGLLRSRSGSTIGLRRTKLTMPSNGSRATAAPATGMSRFKSRGRPSRGISSSYSSEATQGCARSRSKAISNSKPKESPATLGSRVIPAESTFPQDHEARRLPSPAIPMSDLSDVLHGLLRAVPQRARRRGSDQPCPLARQAGRRSQRRDDLRGKVLGRERSRCL